MATLTGQKIKDSYKDLLQVSNSNSGIDGTLRTVSDGEATDGVLQLSTSAVNISSAGALQYAGTAITSTAAELNVLDGYTGSVTELNYLDTLHATGVTSTEFDYLDGVTSNIQTQLDGKQATLTSSTNITTGDITIPSTTGGDGFIYLGQHLNIYGKNKDAAAAITMNSTYDGGQLDTYTPIYSGDANAGQFIMKQQTGGSGSVDVFVKAHGTTSTSAALSTFTKVAEFNDNGYFNAANGLYISGAQVTSTSAELNYLDGADSSIATLSLPDNTTISTFGASVIDDANAAAARTTLGVDAAGTDNSTNVTLAGSLDYITISGQEITRNAIDLAADVTGTLPVANGGTGATSLNNLITLTTHTTGNYVAGISGTSNEIEVSGSGSEGATVTIGLPNDVTIAGNLTVNGDTVTVNTSTLSVEDPLIKLATGNNAADSVDIGFYGLYDTSGSQDLYAGLFRDANDSGKFKLFKDLQAEPTTTVNTSGTGYAVGTLVANIEGTIGTATQGTIDHDSLANFVANEHIDHTSVTLTAGSGLTGGGTIAANRTFNVGAGTGITVNADDIQTNDSEIVHDNLSGFVANEHVDHSSVTLTAGNGLSGGGDITSSRSFAVDLNELTTETTIADADFIAMVDATDNGSGKITFENLEDAIFASVSGDIAIAEDGTATIQANSVALATDTTGDYVASITGGTGIDSTGATSGENIGHTLSLDLNELTTETAIAQDDFVAMVDNTDSGSGKITFSNLEDEIFGNVSGDITIAAGGAATIQANSVALGTDTTGNYVGTITAGTGLTSTGATSGEGIAHSLSVDAAQTQITSVGTLTSLQVDNVNINDSTITNSSGDLTIVNTVDDQDIILQSDDGAGGVTAYITLDGSIGRTEFSKDIKLGDSLKINMGTSNDLKIYHDGSHSYIQNQGSATSDLIIQNDNDDRDILFVNDDESGGLATYLQLDGSTGNIRIPSDSVRLQIGAGQDLVLFHDGTDSTITNSTGDLEIKNTADDKDIIFQTDNGSGGVTSYLTLDGSQNDAYFSVPVAIGNTNPTQNLDMNGKLKLRNTSTPSAEANSAMFFANSGEMRVMDASGNNTLLSPHNFSLIPGGASEDRAWSYYSENQQGQKVNVDMMRLARLVEGLTGEKLIYTEEDE